MTATGCAPGVTSSARREQPSLVARDAEQVEEVAGDDHAADQVGLVVGVQAGGDAAPRRDASNWSVAVAKRGVGRVRDHVPVVAPLKT